MPKTLITGAASGIGRAVAGLLAGKGHTLVLVDIGDFGAGLPGQSNVTTLTGNVADERFWAGCTKELAGLTHAVVNAGVSSAGMIAELDFAEWRRVMSVNIDGAFLTLRAAIRAIKASSGPRAIVVTASVAGMKPEPGVAAYGASKAAVIQLAKVAAKELAADGIRVNAIAPGGVDTPIWDEMPFFQGLVAADETRVTSRTSGASSTGELPESAGTKEMPDRQRLMLETSEL